MTGEQHLRHLVSLELGRPRVMRIVEQPSRERVGFDRRRIAHHTGQSLEKVRADTERDYFMSSEEAKEYGIIDRVISQH